jgi:hypothetical protein
MSDTSNNIIKMLKSRAGVAKEAYDEIHARIERNVLSTEEWKIARLERHRASARWTEAQEALAEALTLLR